MCPDLAKIHLFGKILKVLGTFLGLVSVRQTFKPNLANFYAIMAKFLFLETAKYEPNI